MVEINWTQESEIWLKDIYDYIAHDNPQAASRVIQQIYIKTQTLSDFPEIGYKYENPDNKEIRVYYMNTIVLHTLYCLAGLIY